MFSCKEYTLPYMQNAFLDKAYVISDTDSFYLVPAKSLLEDSAKDDMYKVFTVHEKNIWHKKTRDEIMCRKKALERIMQHIEALKCEKTQTLCVSADLKMMDLITTEVAMNDVWKIEYNPFTSILKWSKEDEQHEVVFPFFSYTFDYMTVPKITNNNLQLSGITEHTHITLSAHLDTCNGLLRTKNILTSKKDLAFELPCCLPNSACAVEYQKDRIIESYPKHHYETTYMYPHSFLRCSPQGRTLYMMNQCDITPNVCLHLWASFLGRS